ncbi:MAG: hypothetical protein V4494_04080 [Chlamydiota bacterium]
MSGTATPQSFSDNFWSESSKAKPAIVSKKSPNFKDSLFSIDETPDFHDPYSDLNLFLSQVIKQELLHCGNSKKWSLKLEEDLLNRITPEFQKKFPHYRLGVSALKKTWEKVSYFREAFQNQKGAITQDGKLNIHFFIKENLKQLSISGPSSTLPVYYYAHQLAVKMSECIAAIDGTRPKLDQLTKTIWAVQRHLVVSRGSNTTKNPYEEYDKIDRLIVKAILEITARDPQINQNELEHQVRESLHSLQEIPSFASLDKITCNISSLLAEKLYPLCTFHTAFPAEQKRAIHNFIRRQIQLCKESNAHHTFSDLVRRILALYMLASNLPKNLSDEEITEAIGASYPTLQTQKITLPQSVYAFIAAESVLMKNDQFCHSVSYVKETIKEAYLETRFLPQLKGKETDILEIVIWKILNEKEDLLEKLPYKIGQKIEEEIANILIENPSQSFSGIASLTTQSFTKAKEASLQKNWPDIERKIHTWTIQGDLLCYFLKINSDHPILRLIKEMWKENEPHESFVSKVAQNYLSIYPQLTSYAPQVLLQIWIIYKHTWYALKAQPQETSFDRFLKWHALTLSIENEDKLLDKLEEICKKCLPLIPFNRAYAAQLLK